jgi:hypothetical protein
MLIAPETIHLEVYNRGSVISQCRTSKSTAHAEDMETAAIEMPAESHGRFRVKTRVIKKAVNGAMAAEAAAITLILLPLSSQIVSFADPRVQRSCAAVYTDKQCQADRHLGGSRRNNKQSEHLTFHQVKMK